MHKFSDFAQEDFIGERIKLQDILGKEIVVLNFKISKSKINADKDFAQIQIEYNNEKRVIITDAVVLLDQLVKYQDKLPYITTIIKVKKYYTFR